MAIPWEEIHQEYVTTRISQREIARKYNISYVTVSRHATTDDWKAERAKYQEEQQKALVQKKRPKYKPAEDDERIPEGSSAFLRLARVHEDLPPIDISDPEQVRARGREYFDICAQKGAHPNPAGVAKYIGVSKSTFNHWRSGAQRAATHKAVAEELMDTIEDYLNQRLIENKGTASGPIFALKNHCGYKDSVEIAQATPPPLGELQDQKELEKRILGTVVDVEFEEVEEKSE